jgi:hypothetical protein
MRVKLVYLAKLVAVSAFIFVLWESIFREIYCDGVKYAVDFAHRLFANARNGPRVLESTSYYLIPFLSLVISKPGLSLMRRLKAVGIGLLAFLAVDFLIAAFGLSVLIVEPASQPEVPAPVSLLVQVLYVSTELGLPLVLWFTLMDVDIRDPLGLRAMAGLPRHNRCPICGKEKVGLVDHIRSAHGEKSLMSWKVRRFLAKSGRDS